MHTRTSRNQEHALRGTRTARRQTAIAVIIVLMISMAVMVLFQPCWASEETPIYKIGQAKSPNGSIVRSTPTTTHPDNALVVLPQGTRIEVYSAVEGDAVQGSTLWYRIRVIDRDLMGYMHESVVELTDEAFDPPGDEDPPGGGEQDFEMYLTQQRFPEDYKVKLRKLHKKYPDWRFEAFHVVDVDSPVGGRLPLAFNKAVTIEAEAGVGRNVVNGSSLLSHRSYKKGDYDYKTDRWTVYDAGGWVAASEAILAFRMDPRTALSEQAIFQFEQLSYRPEIHTVDVIKKSIRGTFMENVSVTYTDLNGNEQTKTYPEIFMDAAERSGANPFFLLQRCLMEVGRNGSDSVSGRVSGYEGYYNFYNIHASAGANPILKALRYAKYGKTDSGPTPTEQKKYLLPWNNPWRAVVGGACWISEGYINEGQDTHYLQKFNVDGDTYGTYWHQYMGNIHAPSVESSRVYSMYRQQNILSIPHCFRIPVYANMPATVSPYPSDNLSRNNWLKSIKIGKAAFDPPFNPERYEYTIRVPYEAASVEIEVIPYHNRCTVVNAGYRELIVGENTVDVQALAESNDPRIYRLKIIRSDTTSEPTEPPLPPLTVKTVNDYLLKGHFLINASPMQGRNQAEKIKRAFDLPKGYEVRLLTASGGAIGDNDCLGTGAQIQILESKTQNVQCTYRLVIYGDPSGDGDFNSLDISCLIDRILRDKAVDPWVLESMDCSHDGDINSLDISVIVDRILRDKLIEQRGA
ncbi:MAG: dockerin type I domain-containing protein [Saccharofermentanales bacterium]|jgi:beta-N-acetylglucosaminidase